MTLILKSNTKFVGEPLGDINGINKVDWHTMLNFSNKRFIVNSTQKTFDDVINFNRGSQGWYNNDGVEISVPSNKERINSQGLLIEGSENNLLLNSNTPTTQNVKLPAGVWHTYKIEGPGTISVTHPSATFSSGTISAGQVGYISVSDATAPAQVTIVGNNQYAQLSRVYNFSPMYSKIPTKNAAVGREIYVVSVKQSAFQGIDECTIVIHVNLHEFKRIADLGLIQPILDVGFKNGARLSIANTITSTSLLGTSPTQRTRLYYNGSEQAFIDTVDRARSITFAVAIGKNKVTVAKNGVLSGEQNFVGAGISEITLGRSTSWIGNLASLNGFVSHFAIFDHAMSSEELATVSASWI